MHGCGSISRIVRRDPQQIRILFRPGERCCEYHQQQHSPFPFANNVQVTTKYLNGLIELIHSNLQSNENASSLENPRKHFQRTLDYIASREYEGVVTTAK